MITSLVNFALGSIGFERTSRTPIRLFINGPTDTLPLLNELSFRTL